MNQTEDKIQIQEKDGYYIFSNFEYDIFHKSSNLDNGYKKFKELLDEKKKFFQDNDVEIVNDQKKVNKGDLKFGLKDILINNSIRSVFFIISFLIVFFVISMSISNVLKKNEIKGGRQFWKNFENEIIKLSEKEIDQETQKNIIRSIKKIGEKYKPFLNELRNAFE